MSLVSNLFIIFVAWAVLLYYLLPKKMRWWGLLLTSYIYYLAAGTKYFPFLLFSTIITYLCGLAIEHEVNQDKKKAKRYLIIGLILNFGMLGVIKYTNFILENINLAFHLEYVKTENDTSKALHKRNCKYIWIFLAIAKAVKDNVGTNITRFFMANESLTFLDKIIHNNLPHLNTNIHK